MAAAAASTGETLASGPASRELTPLYEKLLLRHDTNGTEPPAWLLKVILQGGDDQVNSQTTSSK